MKRLLSLLLCALLLLTLATVPALAEDKLVLKFANHMVLEAGTEPFWTQFEKDFEGRHPEIDLQYVTAPYGEMLNTVINMAGGGDRIDLMVGEIGWTPVLEDSGLLCPVTDVMPQEYLDDFFTGTLEAAQVNGVQYALPMYMTPYVLFYNRALFEQAGLDPDAPPTTYDEMLSYAEKLSQLTTADGNKVYAFGQTTASVPVSGMSLIAMVYNFGGRVLTEDGQLDTDNEGFRQAYEMLALLEEKGYNPQNAKLKDLRNLFALGQLAMYYDQAWGFGGVRAINPDALSFAATAAPLKGGSGNGDSIVSSHCLLMVDNGEEHKAAIRLLVEELITEETLSEFMSESNPAYPAKKAMAEMKSIQESTLLGGAASSLESAQACPFIPALNDFCLELCTLAQNVTLNHESFDTAYAAFVDAAKGIID